MKKRYFFISTIFLSVLLALSVASSDERDYWPTKNWKPSPPDKQDLDSKTLTNMNVYINENLPQTSSVLVVRHGYIVFAKYYKRNKEDLRTLWSVTKSITSALIGIATAHSKGCRY